MLSFLFIGWILQFVVQSLSCVCLCSFMNPAYQASLSFTISWRFLELMFIVLVMPSHHCIFCCLLLLLSLSFPASVSFPMNWLFASGGQSIGASASASIFPMNVQGWFPLGLTDLIPLLSEGLSRALSSTAIRKYALVFSLLYSSTLTILHDYCFDYMDFVGKVTSLVFNMLSQFVRAIIPRSKCL